MIQIAQIIQMIQINNYLRVVLFLFNNIEVKIYLGDCDFTLLIIYE